MKRNHNLDILRIIAMMMIVIHHITINDIGIQAILNSGEQSLSNIQLAIGIFMNAFVVIGVNLFFLLSGYFRINFKWKKVVSIIVQIFIIFNIITLIGIFTGYVELNTENIISMINPVREYWFLAVYIFLMFLSPYLNRLIDSLDKKEAKRVFIIIAVLFSLYAFFFDLGLSVYGGYSVIWGICMYIIGGLISKFKVALRSGLPLYIITSIVNGIIIILLFKTGNHKTSWLLYKYNFPLVFASSLFLFLWFNSLKINIKNTKLIGFITFLATNTMMVYLIHSGNFLTEIRRIPTNMFIINDGFRYLPLFVPIYALLILIVCSLISELYKRTIDKLVTKPFDKKNKKHAD